MTREADQPAGIQHWIDRLQAGDERARAELLNCAAERLTYLTRKMLKDFPGVRRWEETDDVLQNASMRLWTALKEVQPTTVCHFYRLAALHIRRELIDLARHHFGPVGGGAHHASDPGNSTGSTPAPVWDRMETTHEPSRLAMWSEFHERVEQLPEEEREVFDLVWYQGLTQAAAAELLNVSSRTVLRRWQLARVKVYRALHNEGKATE